MSRDDERHRSLMRAEGDPTYHPEALVKVLRERAERAEAIVGGAKAHAAEASDYADQYRAERDRLREALGPLMAWLANDGDVPQVVAMRAVLASLQSPQPNPFAPDLMSSTPSRRDFLKRARTRSAAGSSSADEAGSVVTEKNHSLSGESFCGYRDPGHRDFGGHLVHSLGCQKGLSAPKETTT